MLSYMILFIIYRNGSGIYKLSFSWSFLHQILHIFVISGRYLNFNSFSVAMNRYLIWFDLVPCSNAETNYWVHTIILGYTNNVVIPQREFTLSKITYMYLSIKKHQLKRDIHLRGSMWSRTKKNHGNKRARPSRDSPLTFKQHFFDVSTKSELTRPSADCQTTVFRGIKQLEEFLKKVAERSRDSGWGHATVGRLSKHVLGCFKQLIKFLKKVTERSRDSGRRSRDHRPTVEQRFFDVSSK